MKRQIVLAGVGGQGLVSAGGMLAEAAAIYEKREALMMCAYGSEARGTFTKAEVIIDDEKRIYFPEVQQPDIVVALQPHENYATWIQAAIESDNIDFDLFHGNYVAGGRKNKTINYFDYLYDESPYSDGEWIDQFAFGNQVVDNTTGVFDVISLNATQVLC